MKNRLAAVFAVLFVVILLLSAQKQPQSPPPMPFATMPADNVSRPQYVNYNAKQFAAHTQVAKSYKAKGLSAGVIPHHLLAGELIASFFKTAKESDTVYDTVILIGPDHTGKGAAVSVADCGFETSYGALECDEAVTKAVLSSAGLGARADNELISGDQSIMSLIPYASYYLPGAKVVCMLLGRQTTLQQTQAAAQLLHELGKEKNLLVIGSVDFSHGHNAQDAELKDGETIKAIQSGSLQKIKSMGNENLDSPETLCTIMGYVQLGGGGLALLDHKSAADYLSKEPSECTTYLVLYSK